MAEPIELVITREFDAPRELVFAAWTDPKHLRHWFAPKGFGIPDHRSDGQEGGEWETTMRSPEGEDFICYGRFKEIRPPERVVLTHAWRQNKWEPSDHETLVTVEFEDLGGRTRMHFHQAIFLTEASRDGHEGGWSECFDRLAGYLAQRETAAFLSRGS